MRGKSGGWRAMWLGLRRGKGAAARTTAPALPVFDLGHDHGRSPRELAGLLGGKGAGLAEMHSQLALPVPPGFVLATPLCRQFLATGWPAGLDACLAERLAAVEQATGRGFGDAARPLLLAVRSGAPVSMPGMLDTVLNLGSNAEVVAALAQESDDQRFAFDTWAKFCRMYATTVLDVPADDLGPPPARDASPDALKRSIDDIQRLCRARGTPIPDDPAVQLRAAIEAVFRSWTSGRAKVYRQREGIPEDLGTAVVVQAMVFGNLGRSSGAGVAFSRDPSTGENLACGDFLLRAQGEDVVAGTHRTDGLAAMAQQLPAAHGALIALLQRLERHYRDLCDVEFTVQDGKLYVLQVRPGKRSAIAAARLAVAMTEDPAITLTRQEAVSRVSAEQLRQLGAIARVKPDAAPATRGVAGAPGVAVGVVCSDPDKVAALVAVGKSAILVRPTTSPEDVHGMVAAAGIVTQAGGMLSHAALVARNWGIPAVCGVDGAGAFAEGEVITIDGTAGAIYRGDQHLPGAEEPAEVATLRAWAAELGLDFAAPAPAPKETTAKGGGVEPVAAFDVLRALQLRGFASAEQLATSLMTSAAATQKALDGVDEGLINTTPRGLHLTPQGRATVQAALAEERRRLDAASIENLYEAFTVADQRCKQLVTEWQVRRVDGGQVANDHGDASYDEAVRAEFARFDAAMRPLLAEVARLVPRLSRYGARLVRAAAAISAGDGSMIASPLKDSYHTVWFELHEELLALAGRDRRLEEQKQA